MDLIKNTPGTRGGPGGRDRTLTISYAKILGETNFQPREFPRSGSKAKDGEKEKRQAGFAVPHSSLTIGLVGLGLKFGSRKNLGGRVGVWVG